MVVAGWARTSSPGSRRGCGSWVTSGSTFPGEVETYPNQSACFSSSRTISSKTAAGAVVAEVVALLRRRR